MRFSRNPFWPVELGARYIQLKTAPGLHRASAPGTDRLRVEFKELKSRRRGYDENFYRGPIGLGVFLSLILLLILGLVYFQG